MIYVPILYITTYVILGSKTAFLANEIAIFCDFFAYGIITSAFFAISGQTPGYRYSGLRLVKKTGEKISFLLAIFRFFVFIFAMSTLFGALVALFSKKKLFFQDLACGTKIISV